MNMHLNAEDLSAKLFRSTIGALEMNSIYLGDQLGYYRAMADGEPVTANELASRTTTSPRYTSEWLQHQAALGLIAVEDTHADAPARRYNLPAEYVPVLVDPDSVLFAGRAAVQLARYGRRLPDLLQAYRTGQAPPPLAWEPEGRVDTNRALFQNVLTKEWLPALKDVDDRLRSEPPARIADIGCGTGWAGIAMALAYPLVMVDGIDFDSRGIETAQINAAASGVAERARFRVGDAVEFSGPQRYDLVTIFEALHDMARPVDTLKAVRGMLADDGYLLIAEIKAEEEFTAPGPEREQCEYGWSLIACLPDAMGVPGTAATGTVMRPSTLRGYAAEAGFTEVQVLPIDTPFWRFYRLIV